MSSVPNEPLAIVGMGCRFPGNASTLEEYWQIMCNQVDAIIPVPRQRWDIRKYYDKDINKSGKTYVKEGGFLTTDLELFDASFFDISPREAFSMDPQQRMLLETSWEVIEDSGIPLDHLQLMKTGVFVGGFCLDSKLIQLSDVNKYNINSGSAAGVSMTILSNRISYALGLTGPSLSVDTACSSSLVATHLACQSIWNKDSDIAIVGGVNAMLAPEYFISMSKARLLSQKGRCYAYDDRADGYIRGEGCGVVLIRPLATALENNDRIYSIILGTGINQDGRTAGISLPNPAAQEKLIREVYDTAGVPFDKINYIEGHGTGTQQGDIAEVTALSNVFDKNENKCLVGSVKTNIGHLEAAAGIAGLIKTSLCLYYGAVPANLHYETPNKNLLFDKIKIQVSNKYQDLNSIKTEKGLYAGVNSFGYGGTNAHALLKSINAPKQETQSLDWPFIYPLSARSEGALKKLAEEHYRFLQNQTGFRIEDIQYTLTCRRTHHHYRAAIVAENMSDLRELLLSISKDLTMPLLANDSVESNKKMVFVYSGMGPQWWGMGKDLFDKNKVFKAFVSKCDDIFYGISGWSIIDKMNGSRNDLDLMPTEIAQPLNFVHQVGITEVLKAWGIKPDCVVGHSVGEVSAAYVSGALKLEDALLVSYHQSRLQQLCAGAGGTLVASISLSIAYELIKKWSDVSIAAINSNEAITLAGPINDLQEISQELANKEIFNRILKGDISYHSESMDVIREDIIKSLNTLEPLETNIAMYSTVTGNKVENISLDASYWWENVRNTVLFKNAIDATVDEDSFNVLLEIGHHPVLHQYMSECLHRHNYRGKVLFSLNRKQNENISLNLMLAELYAIGFNLKWDSFSTPGAQIVDLPRYVWQKHKYSLEKDNTYLNRHVESPYLFLSNRILAARPSWEVELNEYFFPYLEDHILNEKIVFPGAGYIEAGLQVATYAFGLNSVMLSDVSFDKLLVIKSGNIQKLITELDESTNTYKVWSTDSEIGPSCPWVCHAGGSIHKHSEVIPRISIDTLSKKFDKKIDSDLFYSMFDSQGIYYGPKFQGLHSLWRTSNLEKNHELFIQIFLPMEEEGVQYLIHPVVLDSAFQSIMALMEDLSGLNFYIPTALKKLYLYKSLEQKANVFAHISIREKSETAIIVNVTLYDQYGDTVCQLESLECRKLLFGERENDINKLLANMYEPRWVLQTKQHIPSLNNSNDIVIGLFLSNDSFSQALVGHLQTHGLNLRLLSDIIFSDEPALISYFESIHSENLTVLYILPSHQLWEKMGDQINLNCMRISQLARSMFQSGCEKSKLFLISNDAHIVNQSDNGSNLVASTLSSLVFLINNELPSIRTKSIDLPCNPNLGDYELMMNEFMTNFNDNDVAIRNSCRYVMQLERGEYNKTTSELISFDLKATYLITGGTSGFGIELARWLVSMGAKNLVLASRNGLTTPISKELVEKFRNHGANIIIHNVDISDFESTRLMIQAIHSTKSPLKGIFHCAMVLDDAYLMDIKLSQYETVFRPKIMGAINLHRATQDISLDYFVMTSSISSLIANVGQANYIAANAFLDAFSAYRRKHKLAATTFNLGVLSGVGVIARNSNLEKYMQSLALLAISAKQTIELLSLMLSNGAIQAAILNFDWLKWARLNENISKSSRFKGILSKIAANQSATSSSSFLNQIPKDQQGVSESLKDSVSKSVIESIASILKFPISDIDIKKNINLMGADSLIVSELRNKLTSDFEVEINLVELLKGISVQEIIEDIYKKVNSSLSLPVE